MGVKQIVCLALLAALFVGCRGQGVLVEFSQSAYSVIEDQRVFNITLVRQGEPGQDIVVSILPDTTAGTARFPSDYGRAIAGTVTFTPGGPAQVTTQLSVLNDDRLEFDETVLLRLQLTAAAITAGGQLGLRREAELTIINDDTEQVIFLQDTVTTYECMGQAAFSVSFTPQRTDIPFTVIVETFDATPVDAIAGVDYQPLRRNVTLSPSVASQTLVVPIIQDKLTERNESFQARIIIPPETQRLGVELGSPSVLTVNIQDDCQETQVPEISGGQCVPQPEVIPTGDVTVMIGSPAYVNDGYDLTLTCKVVGGGIPITISWYRDGVLDSSRGNTSTIKIENVDIDKDNGAVYTCRADNNNGHDKQHTIVDVFTPLCSHEVCWTRKKILCIIPDSTCLCKRQMGYCSAAYYSTDIRPIPATCTQCSNPTDLSCLKRWSGCVKRSDVAANGRPTRRIRTAANFKIYTHPC